MFRGTHYCAIGAVASALLGGCDWPNSWNPLVLAPIQTTDGSGGDQGMTSDMAACTPPALWAQSRLATKAQWLDVLPGSLSLGGLSPTLTVTPPSPNFQATPSPNGSGIRFTLGPATYLDPKLYLLEVAYQGASLGTHPLPVKKILFNDVSSSKTVSAAANPLWFQPVTDRSNSGAIVKSVFLLDSTGVVYGVDRNLSDPGFSVNAPLSQGNNLLAALSVSARNAGPSRFIGYTSTKKLSVCVRSSGDGKVDQCNELNTTTGVPALPAVSVIQFATQPGVFEPPSLQQLAVWGTALGDTSNALYECVVNFGSAKTTGKCNKVTSYTGTVALMTLGDIDGDVAYDPVVSNPDNTLDIFLTNDQGVVTRCTDCFGPKAQLPPATSPDRLQFIRVIDVDHDGLQDIVGVNNHSIHVWHHDAVAKPPYFSTILSSDLVPATMPFSLKSPAQVVLGDLTGDPARAGLPDLALIDQAGNLWVALNQTPAQPDIRCSIENPWRGRFGTLAPILTNRQGQEQPASDASILLMALDIERDPVTTQQGLLLAKSTELLLWKNATQ